MQKTIEIKKDGFTITLALDKVLYVMLPDPEPTMRNGQSVATVYLPDASFNVSFVEGKKVRDAMKGFD